MNNRINPYQNALIRSLQQTPQRSEAPVRQEQAAPSARTEAVAPQRNGARFEGLSQVEQQMIERYFPKSETMTLRLYGANRNTQTINPGAVGTHLDVRG